MCRFEFELFLLLLLLFLSFLFSFSFAFSLLVACIDGDDVFVRVRVRVYDLVPFSFALMMMMMMTILMSLACLICRAERVDDYGGGLGHFDFCHRHFHGCCFCFFPAIWRRSVGCGRCESSCSRIGVGNCRRAVGVVGVGIGSESRTAEEMGVENAFGCFLFCCG